MPTIKTQELTGAALDWAVNKATGELDKPGHIWRAHRFTGNPIIHLMIENTRDECAWISQPSTSWVAAGRIIERERIAIYGACDDGWRAEIPDSRVGYTGDDIYIDVGCNRSDVSPTPIIAVWRCYVAAKLGDSVEVPDELVSP